MNPYGLPYTIKQYWINVIVSFLMASMADVLFGVILGSETARTVYIFLLIYWIVIEVRRFHDANKSGWLALINLLPGIGTLAALILAGVMRSDYEGNKWYKAVRK